jgi:hypothetical protein
MELVSRGRQNASSTIIKAPTLRSRLGMAQKPLPELRLARGGEGWQSRIDADLKRLNKIK